MLKANRQGFAGFDDFCQRTRAASNIGHLKTPVFLFSSEADAVVPAARVKRLGAAMRAKGVSVTVKVVGAGDHYSSMINAGIPAAIEWMRAKKSK